MTLHWNHLKDKSHKVFKKIFRADIKKRIQNMETPQ